MQRLLHALLRGGREFVRDLAVELEKAGTDEPCLGIWAVHALYELGLDSFEVQASWRKLAGRPTGRVRAFIANLEGEKREAYQHHLTQFGKNVPSVRKVA